MITRTPRTCQPTETLFMNRQEAVDEDVDDRVEQQDDQEEQEGLGENVRGVAEVDAEDVDPVEAEQRVEEARRPVGHRGDDADQADDVEPAGEPAPARAAEPRGPPVWPAGGGKGRRQLRHRQGDQQDERADHWPADRRPDRAAVEPGLAEAGEGACEDGDDRERDREVGESTPAARKLLPVAHLVEPALVLGNRLIACRELLDGASPLPSPSVTSGTSYLLLRVG